ncbi:carbohydrate ABC transporter permease [Anaerolineales bacterium HSG6]|nr:carbohydrate ABC transporter permease [Anaerolineales bacterium HSG6]
MQTDTKQPFSSQDHILNVVLLLIGLLVALPILIALLTSFKVPKEVVTYPPQMFPTEWTTENYVTAWNSNPFGRFLVNSFIQTGLITLGQVVFSVLAAFAFSSLRFPGRDIMFYFILGSLMIPFELTVIPNVRLINGWGWGNTYQGLVVPFMASAFGVFMLRQFFLSVPKELHEAAVIDGASNWWYLWHVMVPLSRGGIGAFSIFAFLSAYNQYFWPLVITNDVEMRTTQIGIRFFLVNVERGADWGAVMAATIIVSAPTLLAFFVAQKQLVRGIAMTGLKG